MELWLVVLLYVAGIILVAMEVMLPGLILGFVGMALVLTSTYFGFHENIFVGIGQIAFALVVIPFTFWYGSKRMSLKADLSSKDGAVSFAKDYDQFLGKEGETVTDLRPAGIIRMDGKKLDVVTAGEAVARGKQVRVVKVEGNRVVVKQV